MQIITVGYGAFAKSLMIPDSWDWFQFDGKLYQRKADGAFTFIRRVGAKVA